MHPFDSSLDASVHNQSHNHRRPLANRACRPRRASLDNGVTKTAELIMLVSSSNKSVASIAGSHHSFDSFDSNDNLLLSTGQWYNYSSDDDYEESDYFATASTQNGHGLKAPYRRGQRRLSLNNCTAMNMTFLANYNVSTADKSDLDVDCHNFDTMSVGTRSSYQSNTTGIDSSSFHPPAPAGQFSSSKVSLISDDSGINTNDADDDDDDDMDSFCDAEFAEQADEEYIRKELGASCIWNEEVGLSGEGGVVVPPPIRRGGKKQSRKHDDDHDETMVLTNTSNNSNPIPNDSAGSTEFTVVNKYYSTDKTNGSVMNQQVNDPFFQTEEDDDMDEYHDETGGLDDNDSDDNGINTLAVSEQELNNKYDYDGQEMNDDEDNNDDDFDADEDLSDCDSFCDAKDDDKADKDYMKKVLGASVYWGNSMEDLSIECNNNNKSSRSTVNKKLSEKSIGNKKASMSMKPK